MDYLSDGITENLIDNLAQLPNLKVMSRSSVFRYKGKQTDPVEIGRALRVRAVLTGRVISRGDVLTISLELVDTRDSRQIWGEQYNRPITDLLPLQQEISQRISDKLRLRLNEPEKKQLAKRFTNDPEAYQLYLKGRFQFNTGTREGFKTGAQYFQEAIRKDPSFALAYIGLADCYNAMGVSYMLPADEIFPRAKESADKALEMDPTLAEGHIALGVYKVFYQWDWAGAGKEAEYAKQLNARFAKSIELNTDLTNHFYCFYLDVLGKPEESIEYHKQALELDPLAFFFYAEMGWSYYIDRKYDIAIEKANKSLSMDPMQALAYSTLGNAYREKKMYPEAIAALKKAYDLDPYQLVELGYGYGSSGNKIEAEKIIAKFVEESKTERVDPANVALIYISTGEKDKAFEWLQKAYDARSSWMTWLKVEPKYDPIRSDARFKDLIHKVGLPS
jgi:TolB-like protein/Tfp pilus assembly protein PilF